MSKNGNPCCGEEIRESPVSKIHRIPSLSQSAPFWSGIAVIDLKIQDLSLHDYKNRYVILLFYPYDFTFMCPTELIQFNDRIEEFRVLGAEVVALSTDSQYSHLAWIGTPRKQGGLGGMKIPLLADKNHEISRKYGVLIEQEGIPLKALFVIDKEQLIRHVTLNEISLARSVDEVLRIVQACQFVDRYGNICPAGPRNEESIAREHMNYFGEL